MHYSLQLPADQSAFIQELFLALHPLVRAAPIVDWAAEQVRESGSPTPMMRLNWGRPVMEVFPLRIRLRSAAETSARHIARRCLVPVEHYYIGDDAQVRVSLPGRAWFFLAGEWSPRSEYDESPGSFSLLTAKAGEDLSPIADEELIAIPASRAEKWMNPAGCTRWMQAPSPAGTLNVLAI